MVWNDIFNMMKLYLEYISYELFIYYIYDMGWNLNVRDLISNLYEIMKGPTFALRISLTLNEEP